MDENIQVGTENTENTQANVQETQEPKKVNIAVVLRDLSKTFSVDLFDENGLSMLKEKLGNQSQEVESLKTKYEETSKKALELEQKEAEYQIKIEALGLGFKAENLEEVLALAKVKAKDGDIKSGLKAVKEQYGGLFVTTNIGTQHNDIQGDKPGLAKTEQEKYMEQSKFVRIYNKNKGK